VIVITAFSVIEKGKTVCLYNVWQILVSLTVSNSPPLLLLSKTVNGILNSLSLPGRVLRSMGPSHV